MRNDAKKLVLISGRVSEVGFDTFLNHYIERLGLDAISIDFQDESISILVRGEDGLVDMLTMACWLGPARAWVEDVRVGEPPRDVPPT